MSWHENRGLNPYIEDLARRLAVAGFAAFAPWFSVAGWRRCEVDDAGTMPRHRLHPIGAVA